ncbi:hypothetical protein BaRGS_00024031 [Batillaria attramentaria]|uniref:Uncharacterized protein n=1 Tax=Batillaria attramentaria TaxID=370345 RepID=A0ABD0KCP6_9CAEN
MGDWLYTVFKKDAPAFDRLHINYKEVCAAVEGIRRWGHVFQDSVVIVHTDNSVAKAVINKGRSRNRLINRLLRKMFWLSVKFNFSVRAIHVPGQVNIIPDTISRLHEPNKVERLQALLSQWSRCRGNRSMNFFYPYVTGCFNFFNAGVAQALEAELNSEVAMFRGCMFAMNTAKTYRTHLAIFLDFCNKLCIPPVPVSESTVARYAAFLARKLKPASVRQYLNIVRILHLESGLDNPCKD